MKKKSILKYIILFAFAFIVSIWIYNYINSSKEVNTETDILTYQKQIEEEITKDTKYTIDNPKIIVNPYGNSPLTALVIFETNDLTNASIQIKGKDKDKDISQTFIPSKVHILPVYGLYPDYENKIIISASKKSKEITIKTDKIDNNITLEKENLDTSDLYYVNTNNNTYTAAYDENGNLRWYLDKNYKNDIQRLNNGHILLGNYKTLNNNQSVGLIEMDLLGKIYYEYTIPGGYYGNVIELKDGNFILASSKPNSKSQNLIVTVDRSTGQIIKEFDLNKILKNKSKNNWFKISSIYYDEETNSITASGQNSNMIVNIDYSTSEINWIISKNQKYKKYLLKNINNIDYPNNPEAVNVNANKIIFINEKNNNRYLTTYEIDSIDKTVKQIDEYNLENNENASLEVLDDNHYLIAQNNKIKELENDKIVLELKTNTSLDNVKKMSLYSNDLYSPTQGIRLETLPETKTKTSTPLIFKKTDESIIKKYDIKLYKDAYGLKVSGKFDKNDKVEIILDNILKTKTYELKDEKDSEYAHRYISENGIKGKYYIYLKINGTIYKLQKYVTFY